MSVCEMCGRSGNLVEADVEGVELKLCSGCTKYGVVKKKNYSHSNSSTFKKRFQEKDADIRIVQNYASLLRNARERKGMTQEDFAKYLNEKESVVANWEHGSMKPRIDVARRIEKVLNLNLLQKLSDTLKENEPFKQTASKKSADEFTLGDFIKVRKRK